MDWRRTLGGPAARRARSAGLALLAILLSGGAALLVLPLAARAFGRGIVLLLDACVWAAMSLSAGASTGTLLRTIGRAAAAALVTRQVSTVLAALVLVAACALYGLQRLLEPDGSVGEESPR
jgi:hypothetical protein